MSSIRLSQATDKVFDHRHRTRPAPHARPPRPLASGAGLSSVARHTLPNRNCPDRSPHCWPAAGSVRVAVIDSDGRRDFRGPPPPSASRPRSSFSTPPVAAGASEIAWYRHLLDGVRRLVAAGAVTPTVTSAGGASLVRWQPVATPVWRGWSAVMWVPRPR